MTVVEAAESRGAPPPPQDPSPLRGTLAAILIPACASSSPSFFMIYSAYRGRMTLSFPPPQPHSHLHL